MVRASSKAPQKWSLGGLTAEKDPLLSDAFIDNGTYSAIVAEDDPHWFIVGRTGSGKTALLKQLEISEFPEKVARISPRELAFHHITNVNAIRTLLGLGVRLEPFFHALWRHLLLCEVVRHRYKKPTEGQPSPLGWHSESSQPSRFLDLSSVSRFFGH